MLRLAAIITLGALALTANAAPVYKCTDEDGRTYYSEQKCPQSSAAEELRVPKPSRNNESAPGDSAENDNGKSLDARIEEAEDPVHKAQLQLLKQECDLARTQLQRYEDAPYLVEKQADGSDRRLSDEEAEGEKQRLRQKLETECR